MIKALEESGLARSLAEPNLVALVRRYRELPGRWRVSGPGFERFNNRSRSPTSDTASVSPSRRPCSGDGLINMKIEPEVSQIDPNHPVAVGNGISVPPLIVRRATTTVELRDGQSFMIGGLLLNVSKNNLEQLPVAGRRAGARRAVPQRVLSEGRDRSRHHRHAAHRAPGAARRRHQDAARRLASGQRRRSVPDGQDRGQAGRGAPGRGRAGRASSPATCSICRREA